MTGKSPSPAGAQIKPVTFRRDGKGALKFNGERIGSATRHETGEDDQNEPYRSETSARLYKTLAGEYVLGAEEYDRTNREYVWRDAWIFASITEASASTELRHILGEDILSELFENTEIAEDFAERID
jgi:hypothetical protein